MKLRKNLHVYEKINIMIMKNSNTNFYIEINGKTNSILNLGMQINNGK